jgi:hypothetical protein
MTKSMTFAGYPPVPQNSGDEGFNKLLRALFSTRRPLPEPHQAARLKARPSVARQYATAAARGYTAGRKARAHMDGPGHHLRMA